MINDSIYWPQRVPINKESCVIIEVWFQRILNYLSLREDGTDGMSPIATYQKKLMYLQRHDIYVKKCHIIYSL